MKWGGIWYELLGAQPKLAAFIFPFIFSGLEKKKGICKCDILFNNF